jgi:hypothetical protein
LLLSSPRKAAYAGKILVVDEQSDKAIRYVKFLATFEENNELYVEVGDCVFPEAGQYSFGPKKGVWNSPASINAGVLSASKFQTPFFGQSGARP